MLGNPEFQRQLQMNWHPSRVLWTALVTLLVLVLGGSFGDTQSEQSWQQLLTSGGGFAVSLLMVAPSSALGSLREEVVQKTWDWQRLSSLGPWAMVWGKQLGSAVTAWLFALWFGSALLILPLMRPELADAPVLPSLGLLLLAGIALQAWAMSSQLARGMGPASGRTSSPGLFVLLALPALPLASGAFTYLSEPGMSTWWCMNISNWTLAYGLAMAALLLGWLSAWRLMSEALDVNTLPWAWPLGLLAGSVVLAGLHKHANLTSWLWLLLLMGSAGTLLTALRGLNCAHADWRRSLHALQHREWRTGLQALPIWTVSLVLTVWATFFLVLSNPAQGMHAGLVVLWLLREVGVATALGLSPRPLRSPLRVFMLYAVICNYLLPMVISTVGSWPNWLLPLGISVEIELPEGQTMTSPGSLLTAVLLAVQVAGVWWWLLRRYRQLTADMTASVMAARR